MSGTLCLLEIGRSAFRDFTLFLHITILVYTSHMPRGPKEWKYIWLILKLPWADCHQWNWKVVMNGYYIYRGWRLRQKIGDRRSEKKRVNSDPERTLAAVITLWEHIFFVEKLEPSLLFFPCFFSLISFHRNSTLLVFSVENT